ncbi:MAG TPA: glycine zipper domain-containing protein [Gemmatimonadaceae bacterium]
MKKLTIALAGIVAAAACSKDKPDESFSKDLALAGQSQAQQQPIQIADTTPSTEPKPDHIQEAPRTRTIPRSTGTTRQTPPPQPVITPRPQPTQVAEAPAPAPTPAPAASRAPMIGAGSGFNLSSGQRICTTTNRPGDRFVATLREPVTGSNGAVIPSGAAVVLEVATASTDPAQLTFRPVSVEFNGMSYRLSGDVIAESNLEKSRIQDDPNGDKKKVIGGAVAGAILGRIIGKSTKGTVIGAAAGGAAGAIAAKASEKYETCLPSGAPIRLTLSQAVTL